MGTNIVRDVLSVDLSNQTTADNVLRVATEKSDTRFTTKYTHRWNDKTTWYSKATKVVDEVVTNSGDNLTYNLANSGIIDLSHGKISNEEYTVDSNGDSYLPIIKVNDTVKTEDVWLGATNDYSIDYTNGDITFHTALDPSDVVKATYHYATTATFTVKPDSGKILKFGLIEVQFSDDIDLTDVVRFTMYGYVDVFAPQLLTTNGGPYSPGTQIPIANSVIFKTMYDYLNDTLKAYPPYPVLGGTSGRGTTRPVYVFDWDYTGNRVLYDSYGMEIRIELDNNNEFGGTFATTTFYCTQEDENL